MAAVPPFPIFSKELSFEAFAENTTDSTNLSASRLIQIHHQDDRRLWVEKKSQLQRRSKQSLEKKKEERKSWQDLWRLNPRPCAYFLSLPLRAESTSSTGFQQALRPGRGSRRRRFTSWNRGRRTSDCLQLFFFPSFSNRRGESAEKVQENPLKANTFKVCDFVLWSCPSTAAGEVRTENKHTATHSFCLIRSI